MHQDLVRLASFIEEMNSSNSTTHKVRVLTKYAEDAFIRKALFYTYHPYKQYGLTSKNLKKNRDRVAPLQVHDDLFAMLDDFNDRNITGHAAIETANSFILAHHEFSEILYQIIDRNLETRATVSLINRAMGNLIPTFNVALAFDANKVKGFDLSDGSWFASRKLDGVRCLAIIRGGKVQFFSRNGKSFDTLNRVAQELISLGVDDFVLDGEICMMTQDGSDDFQGILKQIQRKDHTIESPRYWVFDILTHEEFESGTGIVPLSQRLSRLDFKSNIIRKLYQERLTSEESLNRLRDESKAQSWEGLIVRRDTGYEGDRTKNMLKLKEFHDAEYQVVEAVMEPQRVIVDGREVDEEMLSAVIVEHRGNRVRVGSGFSLDERRKYHRSPEEIVGAVITVRYFEETTDQHGNHSLRFPVFKWNHGESRSI